MRLQLASAYHLFQRPLKHLQPSSSQNSTQASPINMAQNIFDDST